VHSFINDYYKTMKFSIKYYAYAWMMAVPTMAWEETCRPFPEIYASGTELCQKMFADSFLVVDDTEPGYTMWFFDTDNNPNDQVTLDIFGEQPVEECGLQYFHKDEPTPEDDGMKECQPWKQRSCCNSTTVASMEKLKESYGEEYHWDRCGPMTPACERFFVYESCFYECEPSAGLYRKYNDSQSHLEEFNTWQMHKMPIKKSFCDSWFDACKTDLFCGDGDFFSCAARYQANNPEDELKKEKDANEKLAISLGVIGSVAFLFCLFSFFLVHRERTGKPVFVGEGGNAVA
jgi:folate receptor